MINDIRYFIEAVKNASEPRDILQHLDYLNYCGGSRAPDGYEEEFVPITEFKSLEKLPELVESLWWRLLQQNDLTAKSKIFFKLCIDLALTKLQEPDQSSGDYLRLIIVIISPKPSSREYRYQDYHEKGPAKLAENLLQHFGSKEGPALLRSRLHQKCSFDNLKKSLNIMKKYFKVFEATESDVESENLIKLVFGKILSTSDEEFKNESKKDLDLIIKHLNTIITNVTENHGHFTELIQTLSLDTSLKCFKSLSLEKRNAGLNDIIKLTKTNEYFKQTIISISQEKLVNWIKENKIVELLYGETMHIQLLQKCTDILKFLAEKKAFERKYLDLMWSAAEGKHETIENVIYDTIGNVSQVLPLSEVEYLYQKIKEIPLSHYTNQTLQLISCLTQHPPPYGYNHHNNNNNINSIDDVVTNSSPSGSPTSSSQQPTATGSQGSSSQPPSPQLMTQNIVAKGVEIFWMLLQDDSEASLELAHNALNHLIETLNLNQTLCAEYLQKCVDNITNHTTVYYSLRIIQEVIVARSERVRNSRYQGGTVAIMGNQQPMSSDPAVSIIRSVNTQTNLLDIFFNHLTYYKKECEVATSKMMNVDGLDQPIGDLLLHGKHSHSEQINDYLLFLHFIFDRSDIQISNEQLNILWQVFAVHPITPKDRDIFFKWTEKANFLNESHLHYILDKFEEITFFDLEQSGATLYTTCMKSVNNNTERINGNLIGVETLWRIALEANNEDVWKEANTFLIELYKYLRTLNNKEEFLVRCMSKLSEIPLEKAKSGEGNNTVMKILSLMQIYIEGYGSQVSDSFRKHFAPTITVNFTGQKIRQQMNVRACDRIGDVKERLGKLTGTLPQRLSFFYCSKAMSYDWETLDDYRVTHQDSILVNEMPEPRPYSHNDDMISIDFDQSKFSLLFSFLSIESIAPTLWEVLMLLPVNRHFVDVLSSVTRDTSAAVHWEQLLDHQSVFKLLYTLLIIDHFASINEWRAHFIESGGLAELINILMTVDIQHESKGTKRKKCMCLLLNIITPMLVDSSTGQLNLALLGVPPNQFLSRLLEISWIQTKETIKEDEDVTVLTHYMTDDGEVVSQLISLIITVISIPEQLEEFCKRTDIGKWISLLLLESSDNSIRDAVSQRIEFFCANSPRAHEFFLEQCLRLVQGTVGSDRYSINCQQFYSLLRGLLNRSCFPQQQQQINNNNNNNSNGMNVDSSPLPIANISIYKPLLEKLVQWIKDHPVVESQNNLFQPDNVLIGLIMLVEILIRASHEFKVEAGYRQDLVGEIFHRCLFDIATSENHGPLCPPKCKTKESREACFGLLLQLINGCQENYTTLVELLIEQNTPDEKRALWNYLPAGNEKSSCGYVGLKNLGATCYINSLMQQLFMIPAFRYSILQTDEVNPSSESLLYQMKIIFANLQESEKKSHDPKDFCSAYKYDGQPINVYVQMDVDEFFNMLFDRLENQLKGTPNEKLLSEFFGGSTVNQFISQECNHVSEREESFYTISVEVKNKRDILESLQLFVESETLDGDNKYFCSQCSQKVKCLMRRCVKKLPNTLIVHNKRFEFDLDLMRRTKLNDQLRFPMSLDMSPYTKEYLERKESLEKEKKINNNNDEEEEQENNNNNQNNQNDLKKSPTTLPQLHPNSYYQYELSGILVHSGTADSGHYYSFIKEREPAIPGQPRRWISFNDQLIEVFNPEDISKACFGGYDHSNDKNSLRPTPRFNNAYMLFYQRVGCPEGTPKLDYQNLTPAQQSKLVPDDIFKSVWRKNMKFLNDKNLFDVGYFSFIFKVLSLDQIKQQQQSSQSSSQQQQIISSSSGFDQKMMSIELGTRFIIETMSHAKERKGLGDFVNYLISMYENHKPGCRWLLETIIENPTWLKQNLLVCLTTDPRDALTKLLFSVIRTLLPEERNNYLEYEEVNVVRGGGHAQTAASIAEDAMEIIDNDGKVEPIQVDDMNSDDEEDQLVAKSIIARFMDTYLSLIKEAPTYWKHFVQYFNFIKEFAMIAREERAYLLSRGVISSLVDFYLGDESPTARPPHQKKTKMGDKYAQPQLAGMLETVALLCRSAHTRYSSTHGVATAFHLDEEPLPISTEDYSMVSNTNFILKTLRDNISQRATNEIIAHLCYGDLDYSVELIRAIGSYDSKATLDALFILIQMEDNEQIERSNLAIRTYLAILENNKHRTFVSYIKQLLALAQTRMEISMWFKNNLEEWLVSWVANTEAYEVRHESFNLVVYLYSLDQININPFSTGGPEHEYPDLAPARQQEIHSLFEYLASNIKQVHKELKNEKENRSLNRFEHYLRLMTLCVLHDRDLQTHFKSIAKPLFKMLVIFITTNLAIEKNRQEMMHFVATMTNDNTDNIRILSNSVIPGKIMDYFISISPKEDLKQFNQRSLPFFYQVLYYLVRVNNELAASVSQHSNFCWALNYLYLECGEYPEVSQWLILITEYILTKFPQASHRLIDSALRFHNFAHHPPHCATLFTVLAPKKRDALGFFIIQRSPNTSDTWVPIEVLTKIIKHKCTQYDPKYTIKMLEIIHNLLSLIRKEVIVIDNNVVAGDDSSSNSNSNSPLSTSSTSSSSTKKDENIQLPPFWDVQNPQFKTVVNNLFNFFELFPQYHQHVSKLFNLIACEYPSGLLNILSEIINKRPVQILNQQQLITNNQQQQQQQQTNSSNSSSNSSNQNQNQNNLPTKQEQEIFFKDMMSIVELSMQGTTNVALQHKGFTLLLKLIKEMIVNSMECGYELLVQLVTKHLTLFKDEEKAGLCLFAFTHPQTLSHSIEFFNIVKKFYVDIEKYLSNQSNNVLDGMLHTVEDHVNTSIASINSLGGGLNDEVDKHLADLTNELKSIEILGTNNVNGITDQITQLFEILLYTSSQIPDENSSIISKRFKSTLESLKKPTTHQSSKDIL